MRTLANILINLLPTSSSIANLAIDGNPSDCSGPDKNYDVWFE